MKQLSLQIPDKLHELMRLKKGGDSFATYIIKVLEKELKVNKEDRNGTK